MRLKIVVWSIHQVKSKAFKIIQQEYLWGTRKGHEYICNICHNCEFQDFALLFDQSS